MYTSVLLILIHDIIRLPVATSCDKSISKIGHLKRCLLFFSQTFGRSLKFLCMNGHVCVCLVYICQISVVFFLIWSLLEKILYILGEKSVDWWINAIKLFRKLNAWLGYTIAVFTLNLNGHQRDKTCLRSFRQRETQTSTLGISLI